MKLTPRYRILVGRIFLFVIAAIMTLMMFVLEPYDTVASKIVSYGLRIGWGLNLLRTLWLLIFRPFTRSRGLTDYFLFLISCTRFYRSTVGKTGQGCWYGTVAPHGVPQLVMMVAAGRDAWRVSHFMTEYIASGKGQ